MPTNADVINVCLVEINEQITKFVLEHPHLNNLQTNKNNPISNTFDGRRTRTHYTCEHRARMTDVDGGRVHMWQSWRWKGQSLKTAANSIALVRCMLFIPSFSSKVNIHIHESECPLPITYCALFHFKLAYWVRPYFVTAYFVPQNNLFNVFIYIKIIKYTHLFD